MGVHKKGNNYDRWFQHCKENGTEKIAREQWDLYWQGVRDVRLHDCAIWLIDQFGYNTKQF